MTIFMPAAQFSHRLPLFLADSAQNQQEKTATAWGKARVGGEKS
jgi:hypothetical protein